MKQIFPLFLVMFPIVLSAQFGPVIQYEEVREGTITYADYSPYSHSLHQPRKLQSLTGIAARLQRARRALVDG